MRKLPLQFCRWLLLLPLVAAPVAHAEPAKTVAFVLEGKAELPAKTLKQVQADVVTTFGPYGLTVGDATPVLSTLLGKPLPGAGSPLPPALAARWTEGQRACARIPEEAATCNRRLGQALWQEWVAQAKPTHLLVLRLNASAGAHTAEWFTWKPGEAKALRAMTRAERTAELPRAAQAALAALVKGRGEQVPLVGGVWPGASTGGTLPAKGSGAGEVRPAARAREVVELPEPTARDLGLGHPDADAVTAPTYLEPDSSDVDWIR